MTEWTFWRQSSCHARSPSGGKWPGMASACNHLFYFLCELLPEETYPSKVTYWFHKSASEASIEARQQQAAGLMVEANSPWRKKGTWAEAWNLSMILNPLMLQGNPISCGHNWNLFCHKNGESTSFIELCLSCAGGYVLHFYGCESVTCVNE